MDTSLTVERIDAATEYADFSTQFAHCGAIVTFLGVVRPDYQGQQVDHLYLDWYSGMSERSLDEIALDTAMRFQIDGLRIVHRCGQVPVGDPIVFVGTAGTHRRATFDAVDFVMDRLKSDIALWKREVGPALDHWVEPTSEDKQDLTRWRG